MSRLLEWRTSWPTTRLLSTRAIQIALGGAWLCDGILQLQPGMFTSAFVTQVLEPAAQGQPAWLARLIGANAHLIAADVPAWNATFAAVQLLIGVGLIVRTTVKPALVLSFVWSIGVWVLGEGCGMVFTGHASPLTGAPGAVLLYGLIGAVVWPARASDDAAKASARRELAGRLVWATVWLFFAALWLMPANTAGGRLGDSISAMSAGQPGWFAHLQTSVGRLFSTSGMSDALALACVALVIGLGPLVCRSATTFFVAGAALSLTFWVFGQAFGGLLTGPISGTATDPNAGPLLALLAVGLVRVGEAHPPSQAEAIDEPDATRPAGLAGAALSAAMSRASAA